MKAKGQKELVEACPYGHIWWNEELQLPQDWTFDAHLIDQGWQQTRGQQSCPTGAMRAIKVEDDEMARIARDEAARGDEARARHQAAGLLPQPVALFEMLHRRLGRRREGTAWSIASKAPACSWSRTAPRVAVTTTDNYGDFKFDKLDENSGRYTSSRSSPAAARKTVETKLGASVNLGEIRL